MMLEMCIAPVILAGLAMPIHTPWHAAGMEGGAVVEVASCIKGPALFVKGLPNDVLLLGGVQWGVKVAKVGGMTFTVTPQFGGSVSRTRYALPAKEQYMVGAKVGVSYGGWTSELGYSHASNGDWGGLCPDTRCQPNVGVDLVTFTAGKAFDWKAWTWEF